MRTMEFKPTICKEGKYEGHILLKVPHFKEKAQMVKTLKFKVNEHGEMDTKTDVGDLMEGLCDIAETMIVESHIKRLCDGVVLSKEDLFYETETQSVITECANAVMGQGGPSKNL